MAAEGALFRHVDLPGRYTELPKPPGIRATQIHHVFPVRAPDKQALRISRQICGYRLRYVIVGFKAAGSDCRADRSRNPGRIRAEHTHRVNGIFQNVSNGTSPATVNSTDDAGFCIAQQYRDAVRSKAADGHAPDIGSDSVRLIGNGIKAAMPVVFIHNADRISVDLSGHGTVIGSGSEESSDPAVILVDVLGIIALSGEQIQRCELSPADAAVTGGEKVPDRNHLRAHIDKAVFFLLNKQLFLKFFRYCYSRKSYCGN